MLNNDFSNKPECPHGFLGEKLYVVPRDRLKKLKANPVLTALLVTDAGYFPKAKYHLRRRPSGCDENIVILCTGGIGTITIPSRSFSLTAPEVVVIPKGIPHEYKSSLDNPWTIYWFHVVGDFIPIYIPSFLTCRSITVSQDRIILVLPVFEHLFLQLSQGNTEYNLIAASSAAAFILASIFLNNERGSDVFSSGTYRALQNVLVYIQDHLDSPISLEDLSARSKLSISRLSQLFHQVTGYSPMQFVQHQRMQKACYYLESTDEPINRIAELVGIDDQFYFSRLFHKIIGVSPRDFRNRKNSY